MGTNSFLSIEPPQLGGRSSDEGVLLEISVYADPMSDQLVGDGLPWGDVKSWRCSSEQGVDHLLPCEPLSFLYLILIHFDVG